jgi:2-oxoglutarate dehydrogenase complex dehydrogenase (E1) component-like enzyme
MYKQVEKMTPVARIYENQLLDQGLVTQDDIQKKKEFIRNKMENAYKESKSLQYESNDWKIEEWSKIKIYEAG